MRIIKNKRIIKFLTITIIMQGLLTLSACQTTNETLQSINDSVSAKLESMDLAMPEVTPDKEGIYNNGNDEDDRQAGKKTASYTSNLKTSNTQSKELADKTQPPAINIARPLPADAIKCPKIIIVKELSELHQFSNYTNPAPYNLISKSRITGMRTKCTVNDNNIIAELDITFEGHRNKAQAQSNATYTYPYFLALTTPEDVIAAKEVFSTSLSYKTQETATAKTETIRQIIPIIGNYNKSHKILLGFQLNETELAYNRSLQNLTKQPLPYSAQSLVNTPKVQKTAPVKTAKKTQEKPKKLKVVTPPKAKPEHIPEAKIKIIDEQEITVPQEALKMPEPADFIKQETRKASDALSDIINEAKTPQADPEENAGEAIEEIETIEIIDITAPD